MRTRLSIIRRRSPILPLLASVLLIVSSTPLAADVGPQSAISNLATAHALAAQGRFADAKREYARVAREQRKEGILPVDALWSLAQMHHGEGQLRAAAHVLKSLAFEASLAGDPHTQARALMEATLLFHSAGDEREWQRGLRQLDQLRLSPYVDGDLREQIDRRLFRGGHRTGASSRG